LEGRRECRAAALSDSARSYVSRHLQKWRRLTFGRLSLALRCDDVSRLASRTHGKPRDRGDRAMRVVRAPHQSHPTNRISRGQLGHASCTALSASTPPSDQRAAVITALLANVAIAIAKLGAAAITG